MRAGSSAGWMAAIRWHEVGNGESAESVGWDQGHVTLTDLLVMMAGDDDSDGVDDGDGNDDDVCNT